MRAANISRHNYTSSVPAERRKLFQRAASVKVSMNRNAQPPAPVTLYVVPDCPLCARARAWLQRHGVAYHERDVARDFGALRAMYKLTGQRFVPVFEFGGRALVRPGEAELEESLLSDA